MATLSDDSGLISRHSAPGDWLRHSSSDTTSTPSSPLGRRTSDSLRTRRKGPLRHRPKATASLLDELKAFRIRREASKEANSRVPDDVLDSSFGIDGTWAVSAAHPQDGCFLSASEMPFKRRDWSALPSSLEGVASDALLRHWGAAAINTKGCKGENDRTVGQDNLCLARLGGGWEMLAVFDGHGYYGHRVSERVARTMAYFLRAALCDGLLAEGDVEAALKHAFEAAHTDLVVHARLHDFDVQISGTTATVILRNVDLEFLWVANVGDSRAIMLDPVKGVVLEETTDHTGAVETEVERISKMMGEVRVLTYEDGFVSRRVYIKGTQQPGLGVTRAIGDCYVKGIGVVAEPEIYKWPVKGREGAYILICSDGVWEFFDSSDVARLLAEDPGLVVKPSVCPLFTGSAEGALAALLFETKEVWRQNDEHTDDITMILAPVTGPRAPPWNDVMKIAPDADGSKCSRGGACQACVAQ